MKLFFFLFFLKNKIRIIVIINKKDKAISWSLDPISNFKNKIKEDKGII
jgi:hypothetical protein